MNEANIIYKQNLRELEGVSGVRPFIETTEGSLFFLYKRLVVGVVTTAQVVFFFIERYWRASCIPLT